MSSLEVLNAYASQPVYFTVDTIVFDRDAGNTFVSPTPTWIPVSQLGSLTGNGVQISYNTGVSNIAVSFPNSGASENPLTVTNPSTGVYNVKGILTIIDYNAAQATLTLPSGFTGNANYSATFTNTNTAAANLVVSFTGT